MAAVYILHSKSKNRFYIGSCNNLFERLEQHRLKAFSSSFTSNIDDWELYYSIQNLDYMVARNIEKHIKKMKSKEYIRNLKKYPEMIQKLMDKLQLK
ncbi:MAG: GIY-YIG nuclease family protein [Flavobacteriales bacterium]|nr:GIY-YIG nuclease family protein [Flavobacteriales bacterium]